MRPSVAVKKIGGDIKKMKTLMKDKGKTIMGIAMVVVMLTSAFVAIMPTTIATNVSPPIERMATQCPTVAPTIFEFIKKFPMDAEATLTIPKELGGDSATVEGKGFMKFGFSPTEDPEVLSVSLKDIRLKVMPFDCGEIATDEFDLCLGDFRHERSHGTLNIESKELSFTFVLVLTPEMIPALKELGVSSEVELTIKEEGEMDIWTGAFETHAETFQLPGGIKVSGGQFGGGCKTDVDLYINVIHARFDIPRRHIKEVWICPGDRVELIWESSSDVSSCDLDEGIGTVPTNGHIDVTPTSDTEYTITAHGKCDETDDVEVHVIEAGDEHNLVAMPDYRTGVWGLNLPVEICSPSIIITSIRPAPCFWGASVWPSWACGKIDPDGTTTYFDIIGRTSPGDIPLAGDWSFVPIVPGTYTQQGNICFITSLRCR